MQLKKWIIYTNEKKKKGNKLYIEMKQNKLYIYKWMEYISVLILFWKLHWEKDMEKVGGTTIKITNSTKLLTTNSPNTTNTTKVAKYSHWGYIA